MLPRIYKKIKYIFGGTFLSINQLDQRLHVLYVPMTMELISME